MLKVRSPYQNYPTSTNYRVNERRDSLNSPNRYEGRPNGIQGQNYNKRNYSRYNIYQQGQYAYNSQSGSYNSYNGRMSKEKIYELLDLILHEPRY